MTDHFLEHVCPDNMDQIPHLPHPLNPPVTPRNKPGQVDKVIKQLNLEHDLKLPCNERRESPSKKRKSPAHEVVSTVTFLLFQDPPGLDRAVNEFRQQLPTLRTPEEKVNYLLERLTIAKSSCRKARTGSPQRARSPNARRSSRSANLLENASPTLSIKNAHAPSLGFEMPADHFQLPPAARISQKHSLKRLRSNESLADKMRASRSSARAPESLQQDDGLRDSKGSGLANDLFNSSRTMPPPMSTPFFAPQPGITSVNTSFTSNGLTSAETSFWSDAQQGTQQSPASSVDESFLTPDAKDDDFGIDGANEIDFSQTNYGSSPRLEDLRSTQIESMRHQQHERLRQSTQTQSDYSGINESQIDLDELEANAMSKQEQLLSPPETDFQPEPHELTGRARVLKISRDGLSSFATPQSFLELPLDLRWEAIRVLQSNEMTLADIDVAWPEPRTMKTLHGLAERRSMKYERGCETGFTNHGLAAKLTWSSKGSGRVFDLRPCPPRKDDSNPFERKFGRDRFLVVDVPPLDKPPKDVDLEDFGPMVLAQVKEMFKQEQHFAGRVWRQFLSNQRRHGAPTKPTSKVFSKSHSSLCAVRRASLTICS